MDRFRPRLRAIVNPRLRGRGHGEHLVRALIEKARSQPFDRVSLNAHGSNSPAGSLYLKLGFRGCAAAAGRTGVGRCPIHGARPLTPEHPAFGRIDHRPWRLPDGRWAWRQTWRDLLFAHWPVPAKALRRFVPEPLTIQEFDGTAWVGLVPFRMTGVMRRPFPDLPWISAFPEVNVRLYVEHGGKPGVWFLSLDAGNPLAVWAGRRFFHLPYFNAKFRLEETCGLIHYSASRKSAPASLHVSYQPASEIYESQPGTLEHSLTEKYCLYAEAPDGSIWRNDVHHQPWPLQRAEAELAENSYLSSCGLWVSGPPALLHFARQIDVVVWPAERCLTQAIPISSFKNPTRNFQAR